MNINNKCTIRNGSIFTNRGNLEPLYKLSNCPVFMGCIEQPESSDLFADMEWVICKDTGSIQLLKLLPLDILYMNHHNDGCGTVWMNYYAEFAEFLGKFNLSSVLEIGGGNGVVAEKFLASSEEVQWTIVEPNPGVIRNNKLKIIKEWFGPTFKTNENVDAIVHSHVLEHVYDPVEFLQNINNFLNVGDYHIFALPNMLKQLENKYTNCLNFEHTIFLSESFVDFLLINNGFKVIEKRCYTDHSIFYATRKVNTIKSGEEPKNQYNKNKPLFQEFIDYHIKMVHELNDKIDSAILPTYIFGAHIFSQFLLTFGLNGDKILYVLDNSLTKQEKRLYGTSLFVKSPAILRGIGPANVILKAGAYNTEIKKDILGNINSEINFW